MKHIGRILLGASTLVSLLLCAMLVVLWVRSYWRSDEWYGQLAMNSRAGTHGTVVRSCQVLSAGGSLKFRTDRRLQMSRPGRMYFHESYPEDGTRVERIGPVPCYALVLITAWLPSRYLLSVIRRRRVRSQMAAGKCAVCGYDLRATPDRCPECGAIPSAGKSV